MNNELNGQQEIILSPKKSGGKKAAVIAAIAVVAVGAAAGICIGVPSVNNSLKMALSSPEDYYSGVIRKEISESADKTAENYAAYCEKFNSDRAVKGTLTITPGPALLEELLLEERGVSADNMKIGCDYVMRTSGGQTEGAADMSLSFADKPLLDISTVVSGDSQYMSIPTISEKWLSMTSEDIEKALGTSIDTADKMKLLDGTVLTKERLGSMADRYMDIYLAHAGNVTLNKNTELTSASGVTSKYTEAVVSIDEASAKAMAEEFTAAIKADSDIKDIWLAAGASEDDYNDLMSELTPGESFSPYEIRTYIAADGSITGIKLTTDSGELSEILYTSGDNFSLELLLASDGDNISFTADGTVKNDVANGSGKLVVSEKTEYYEDEYNISFTFDDLDVKKLENGDLIGNISVDFSLDDTDSFSMSLIGKEDHAEATASISTDGENLLTVFASSEDTDFTAIEIPQGTTINILDQEALMDYIKNSDYSKLKSNISALSDIIGQDAVDYANELIDSLTADYDYDNAYGVMY